MNNIKSFIYILNLKLLFHLKNSQNLTTESNKKKFRLVYENENKKCFPYFKLPLITIYIFKSHKIDEITMLHRGLISIHLCLYISVVFCLSLYILGITHYLTNHEPSTCDLTYMFEYPEFVVRCNKYNNNICLK